jgi:predicted nuclease with TOPRIM domain
LGNKKVSNFNAESVFNENAINRAESLLKGPDTNIFNFGESTITTVSSLSGSDISGLTVRQLADLDPRRAFDELAIKYKRLKSENKSLMMMIRVKNLTIKDLEQTLENVKNSVGVKTEDEGEMSEESYNEIFTKMKEFEAQKSKFEEMELKLAELQPLTNIKQEFDELEEKFNLLKSKSISLYQEKQKLEEDNMTLSGLVVKYKNEKADILRVSQNAVQDLKAQNDQYLQEIEKLQLLKIPEVDLKILKL